jgi:hypothetical protein
MRVHPVVYHLFKTAIRLGLVAIFLGIPIGLYALRTFGIGFGAREALEQALSSPAIHVRIGEVMLDPFSGLVAREVAVSETGATERLLAKINRISISLNLSELMERRIAVDTLSLVRAEASIPVGPGEDAPRLEAREINASLVVLGDRLRLSQFEGLVEGIRIRASGEILNPFDFQPGPEAEPDAGRTAMIEKLLAVLRDTEFPNGGPALRAEFEIDAARPESLQIDRFELSCALAEHPEVGLESIDIRGSFANGSLRIPVLRIRDAKGQLQASAEWNTANGDLRASLLSNLDPQPFLAVFGEDTGALSKLAFPKPPQINADLQGTLGGGSPSLSATGGVLAPELEFQGVRFVDAGFDFSWKDGVLYAREVRAAAERGEVLAKLWIAPGDLRLQAHSTIPPSDFAEFVDPNTREFLSNLKFEDLPSIDISLRAPRLDFAAITGTGHLKVGRTACRGAWIDSGTAELSIADRCVTYKNLTIATGKGRGTGSFDYDVGKQEVRLRNIVSTLVPVDVLMWIDPRIAKTIQPYRFRAAPDVRVEGKVHMKDPLKNNLAIRIDAPGGMNYDLLGKTLRFGKTRAVVNVVANKVDATVTNAEFKNGTVGVKAVVSIDPKNPTFRTEVTLNRVNFARLTNLYFDYDDSKGVISGRYGFQARMGAEEEMTGAGSLRIEEGNVFAIPVFGPFSAILGGILPGVVYNTARLATADFTVANKKVTTRNIEIAGRGFSMFGNGDIYFLTGRLDLSMRINVQGIPGLVFFPVSKLLEYHSEGTIADPRWRPKIIPKIPLPGGKRGGS